MEHRLHRTQWQSAQIVHTKDYILKEYNDVFKGVGTVPGGPYHTRLKEQCRPVQHPLRSVMIGPNSGIVLFEVVYINEWNTPQEAASWLHEPASMYEVIPS